MDRDMGLFNWQYFLNNGKYLKKKTTKNKLDMHFEEAPVTNMSAKTNLIP